MRKYSLRLLCANPDLVIETRIIKNPKLRRNTKVFNICLDFRNSEGDTSIKFYMHNTNELKFTICVIKTFIMI